MKARPLSDPTSWDFQVNIHATRDLSNPAVWNQCQHGNYYFLPWHRMYIYWFERILRDASGDPELALPYWNYTSPAARTLPEVYRVPAIASNPLYVAERNTDAGGVNNGARLPASAAATAWLPFRLVNFSTALPSGAAFGGRVVDRPVHLMPTMGSFESYHNVMHVLIGGENGYMSDPTAASRDPIFFAHHANVDRLWNRWLDQGGGRANPLDDRTWMDTRFKFFDEKGRPREIAVRDALDEQKLGYRYDDDPTPLAQPRPARTTPAAPSVPMAASEGPPGASAPMALRGSPSAWATRPGRRPRWRTARWRSSSRASDSRRSRWSTMRSTSTCPRASRPISRASTTPATSSSPACRRHQPAVTRAPMARVTIERRPMKT